jgi:hypothetical protein
MGDTFIGSEIMFSNDLFKSEIFQSFERNCNNNSNIINYN